MPKKRGRGPEPGSLEAFQANRPDFPVDTERPELGPIAESPEPPADVPPAEEPSPSEDPRPSPTEPSPVEETSPSPTPAAASGDDEPEETEDERVQRLVDERVQREMEFFRLGAQATQPAGPAGPSAPAAPDVATLVQQQLANYRITPADWQVMLEDPQKAVEFLQNAMTVSATIGAQIGAQHASHGVRQQIDQDRETTALRDQFYREFPDLVAYPEIVQAYAIRNVQSMPGANNTQLIAATGRACRARVKELGWTPPRGAAATPTPGGPPARRRPAGAEMGTTSRGGGAVAKRRLPEGLADFQHRAEALNRARG